MNKLIIFWT